MIVTKRIEIANFRDDYFLQGMVVRVIDEREGYEKGIFINGRPNPLISLTGLYIVAYCIDDTLSLVGLNKQNGLSGENTKIEANQLVDGRIKVERLLDSSGNPL